MANNSSKAPPKKVGRPSRHTPKLSKQICDLIREGWSERKISKLPGMPSFDALNDWKAKHPDFLHQSARAREESAEKFNDDLLELQEELKQELTSHLQNGEDFPKGVVEAYKTLMQEKARQAAWRDDSRYGDRKTVKVDATEEGKGMAEVYARMLEAQKNE